MAVLCIRIPVLFAWQQITLLLLLLADHCISAMNPLSPALHPLRVAQRHFAEVVFCR
jgi:hypothetical protein